MNRRQFLRVGAGAVSLSAAGCLGSEPAELRVRNTSDRARTIHVRVFDREERLLSRSFDVPSKADSDAQGTVDEVYPRAGTYRIEGAIDGGRTVTESVELADDPLTHVTAKSGGELNVGRMAP